MVQIKQKCSRCKVNYVTTSTRSRNFYPVCYECEKKSMEGEIADPEMKKLLDIPEEMYKESSFLRSIKINCIRYGKLSENQINAFKKIIADMQARKDAPAEELKLEDGTKNLIQEAKTAKRKKKNRIRALGTVR